MTFLRVVSLATATTVTALPALAQEITFALGATSYTDAGEDSGIFSLEYRHKPFFERNRFSSALGASASVTGESDVFIGAGLWSRFQFENGVFIDSSLMPGYYDEGTAGNDLGSDFEIRSLLGVGYKFDNGQAISAAIAHKSHAGLGGDDNPGVNTFSIRYHVSF